MDANTQILQASVYGTLAFKAGIESAPCLDKNVKEMIRGREVAKTPAGEASTVEILKAWRAAWHAANAAAAY